MSDFLPARMDVDAPLFTVTMAARLAEMHPQTLRGYDRLGLVVPSRAKGRGRRYTLRDVARLRHIQELSQEEGINLEGIRRILELEAQLEEAHGQVSRLVEIIQAHQVGDDPSGRTFTAGHGTVHLGRTVRLRSPRALPSGR
ncbi:MerR family transcriptional regulator [Propioniciclava sp. MC1595]|uniref:heat shock protein transcriptional repressor HspR n=1 Tax=Propioniciclava sp. MC1595 TaxID=2760308 RepID=UPI0016622D57|nr:MerR family transcriptional regulator [Propioniciclava sp. MC1595]MBB1496071.1 MerR family transcriptional regulator [Propioniciclava sp. MC1595]QTE26778.1 MerR family transcriptional regulator [Propioniciclava sp. MC1595]